MVKIIIIFFSNFINQISVSSVSNIWKNHLIFRLSFDVWIIALYKTDYTNSDWKFYTYFQRVQWLTLNTTEKFQTQMSYYNLWNIKDVFDVNYFHNIVQYMLSNLLSLYLYIEVQWRSIDNFNKFNFKAQSVTWLLHVIKPIIDARDDGPFYILCRGLLVGLSINTSGLGLPSSGLRHLLT